MLNQTVLVGRLVNKPEKNDKGAIITISIPRSFKNEKGEYETDLIPIKLISGIAQNTVDYCNKGDVIGIKGRLQANEKKEIELIAERITFLSSKKEEMEK